MATKCNDSKRRDHKGRILKTGESQRSDLTYQYRYTDAQGKRKYIYNSDLKALREEAALIAVKQSMGIDYAAGKITVIDLVKRYTEIRRHGVKPNTCLCFDRVLNRLKVSNIGYQPIRDVKMNDAKQWFVDLTEEGYSRSMLKQIRGILRPAFESALQEDIIHKNPFNFTINFVPDNTRTRDALSVEDQKKLLEFARNDSASKLSYHLIVILLGTGLRGGELCGLTFDDVDFVNRRIFVRRQLLRHPRNGRYIETPKSKCSVRTLPMTDAVYASLKKVIELRPKFDKEPEVDGVSGFLFFNQSDYPMLTMHVAKTIWLTVDRYNRTHADQIPHTTTHNLRHSFCTNLIDAGMNPKNVQYLMGHASITVTLNIYAHSNDRKAEQDFLRVASVAGL